MPNTVNYATKYERQLKQKYKEGLKTADLTTPENSYRFLDAKTIKIPFVNVGGFGDHSRDGGWNRRDVDNDWMTKTLGHDRDVEFFVDAMDVDETNQALSALNITGTFMTEHDIPETDAYRISKAYADFLALGQTADTTAITTANALTLFDTYMEQMDNDEVPGEGRILYATPNVFTMLKQAQQISRSISVTNNNGEINRVVRSLDDVELVKVPPARMKTEYDFTNGFVPAAGAKQINMMLLHPRSVIAVDKHSYIKLWPEGTHTEGDGWLFQFRKYGDLFLIDTRIEGIKFNREA
ncbi:MAG: capsid protein [Oscillospiraceae bacterium]